MNQQFCNACPRACGVDRSTKTGFCGIGDAFVIARVGLHLWEEPCISYGNGSGTVFFSGCNLRCVFCQNHAISAEGKGKKVSAKTLEEEILALQDRGAANINLVTPSHMVSRLVPLLQRVRPKLSIPIIYNTSGYDKAESLRALEGLIDIYLPDFKYASSSMSARYSAAPDYFLVAAAALEEMMRQVGYAKTDKDGHMKKGVMVRHLVLPGGYRDSIRILNYLAEHYDAEKMAISLMSQYFPAHLAKEDQTLNRRITTFEYKKVVGAAQELGFVRGYMQERSSAKEEYVPNFDYGET